MLVIYPFKKFDSYIVQTETCASVLRIDKWVKEVLLDIILNGDMLLEIYSLQIIL